MNIFLEVIPPQWQALAKRIGYFLLGTILTFVYAQLVQAQTPTKSPIVQNPYSVETIIAALVGAIITILFLRGMYLVLTYASETYGLEEDNHPNSATESEENNTLLYGLGGWVIGSALVITSYGWGPIFLYIGPVVCLLGPLVPIVAMNLDIKKYREVLASKRESYLRNHS